MRIFSSYDSLHIPRWRGPLVSDVLKVFDPAWVVTPAQAVEVWGFHPRRAQMPYTLETIRWCAAQNRLPAEPQEWRLSYLFNFSLREMHELLSGGAAHPCFGPDRGWLEKEKKARSWAGEPIEARCYLINLCGHHENMSWGDQEQELRVRARPRVVRVPSAVLAQTLFDLDILRGKRMLSDWSHWGPEECVGRQRVCVGPFGQQGLAIGGADPLSKDPRRAVCYTIPPEF